VNKLIVAFQEYRSVVTLTFKIFWIVVFVLEMIANKSGTGIPQFVYVNF
jgi:hypothetical protein